MGMMSHGNAKKIWVILTQVTMAVTLSVSGSAEDAGMHSSAARARVGIQGGQYLPGGWPDVGFGDRSGLESSYIGAAQNLQIRHFTCVELQDMDKITRTALHNMCIDRTCRLD